MTNVDDERIWRAQHQRTVSLTAYVGMLAATNIGWIIGTILYHHFN